jgi:nitroreductase
MKNLFDLSFTRFVSPSIARIVYILIMVALGLGYILVVIAAFASRNVMLGILVMLIIGPLVVLIYLALARIGLESLVAGIRTAENTAEILRIQGGTPPGLAHAGRAGGPTPPNGWNQTYGQPPASDSNYPPNYQPPAQ